ncbi:hypothetical protein ACIBCS_11395 [Streptomyces phaeochromogenes]|uniref:hypothetical protein n=1 Tax=Streptomyces phaeochromogenes TaxID=1923 RepID=UPI0033F26425
MRKNDKAMELRCTYDQLRESDPSPGLSAAGTKDKVLGAMHTWELANRDSLTEAEVEDTHFFGFAGQRRPAQLIDFVFVSADLQAYEEADYQKATAQPRCLLPVVLNSGAVVSARVDDGAMSNELFQAVSSIGACSVREASAMKPSSKHSRCSRETRAACPARPRFLEYVVEMSGRGVEVSEAIGEGLPELQDADARL